MRGNRTQGETRAILQSDQYVVSVDMDQLQVKNGGKCNYANKWPCSIPRGAGTKGRVIRGIWQEQI